MNGVMLVLLDPLGGSRALDPLGGSRAPCDHALATRRMLQILCAKPCYCVLRTAYFEYPRLLLLCRL